MTEAKGLCLEDIVAIWPIASTFASHLTTGDLINLSRTSPDLRSILHGVSSSRYEHRRHTLPASEREVLQPPAGQHQTSTWIHLRSLTSCTCSSKTHTKGTKIRGCIYCSMPICEACIVRDSFKHRNENTFKNRLRYLCPTCWTDGQPTRQYRYPSTVPADGDAFCTCTLKDNGWLCLECKRAQNAAAAVHVSAASSSVSNSIGLGNRDKGVDHEVGAMALCHGLECTNMVDLALPDKDRRRVCLWCERPMRRQFSGEDRYAWSKRLIEKRAINAESRSRDLEEYNRNRLRGLRVSRREMRGLSVDQNSTIARDNGVPDSNDHNSPILLRHLDAFNYRNYMPEHRCPTPLSVYKSKNGIWQYDIRFLLSFQSRVLYSDGMFNPWNASSTEKEKEKINQTIARVREVTAAGNLSVSARTNLEMVPKAHEPSTESSESNTSSSSDCDSRTKERNPWVWLQLRTRILDAYVKVFSPSSQERSEQEASEHFLGLSRSSSARSLSSSPAVASLSSSELQSTEDDLSKDLCTKRLELLQVYLRETFDLAVSVSALNRHIVKWVNEDREKWLTGDDVLIISAFEPFLTKPSDDDVIADDVRNDTDGYTATDGRVDGEVERPDSAASDGKRIDNSRNVDVKSDHDCYIPPPGAALSAGAPVNTAPSGTDNAGDGSTTITTDWGFYPTEISNQNQTQTQSRNQSRDQGVNLDDPPNFTTNDGCQSQSHDEESDQNDEEDQVFILEQYYQHQIMHDSRN